MARDLRAAAAGIGKAGKKEKKMPCNTRRAIRPASLEGNRALCRTRALPPHADKETSRAGFRTPPRNDSGRIGSRQRLRCACIASISHSSRMTNDLHNRFPFIKNTLRSDYLNFLNLIKKSLTRRFLSCYLSPQAISPGNRIRIRKSMARQSTSVFITFKTRSS
ncbi:hypothetical protein LGN20_00425 [Burkholderia cepacia]|uniref:hypothetical protein n=1 Tax=Burkholderia cepacia TaxID=292 RepID=UPI001CF23B95|nr:hypothetical protein [Burkholderia cepacia]MCA8212358.1 hypothetical protein [Burkholderia cepacia]